MHRQLRHYSSSISSASSSGCDDGSPESNAFAAANCSHLPATSTPIWRQPSMDSVRSYSCSEFDDDDNSSLASSQLFDEQADAESTTRVGTDSSSASSDSSATSATPQRLARVLGGGVLQPVREYAVDIYPNQAMQRTRSVPLTRSNASISGSTSALPSPLSSSSDPRGAASFSSAAAGGASIAACSSAVLPSAPPGLGQSQSWTPGQPPPQPYQLLEPLAPAAQQQQAEEDGLHGHDALPQGQPQHEQSPDSPSSFSQPQNRHLSTQQSYRRNDAPPPSSSSGDSECGDGLSVASVALDRRLGARLEDSSFFPPLALAASSPWWAAAVLHNTRGASAATAAAVGQAAHMHGVGLNIDANDRAPPPSRAPSLQRQRGVYDERTSRAVSLPPQARKRLQEQMAIEVRQREAAYQQSRHAEQQQQQLARLVVQQPSLSLPFMRGPSVPLEHDPATSASLTNPPEHDADSDELPPG